MLELVMKTDLQEALPQEIGFNFEELKSEIAERVDHYNHLVVTEDTIKEAKTDRAKLNKLRTAIDQARKDTKKVYMKPYTDFEDRIKEVTALIDEPIKAIDTQLMNFEEKRAAAKKDQVREVYQEIIQDEIKDIIPLNRILDPKWINATTSMKQIKEELTHWNNRVNADMLALDTVEPEYKAGVKQKYIETLDVSKAIAHKDALKAAEEAFRAREAERIAREEERRKQAEIRAEEARRRAEELEAQRNTQPVEETPVQAPEKPRVELVDTPKLHKLTLEFQLTRAQAEALKEFLDSQRISYRKIEEER